MDPRTESEAIEILAKKGYMEYCKFLKSKGEPKFLSSEEIYLIRKQNFDIDAICDQIKSRATGYRQIVVEGKESCLEAGEFSSIQFTGHIIKNELLSMIDRATGLIQLAMFIFTDADLFKALYNKARASVEVQICVDKSKRDQFDQMLQANLSLYPTKPQHMVIHVITGFEHKPGIAHKKLRTGFAHEKFMVTDSKYAFTGSFNFTWSAATVNREQAVFTTRTGDGGTIIPALEEHYTSLLEKSEPYIWPEKRDRQPKKRHR